MGRWTDVSRWAGAPGERWRKKADRTNEKEEEVAAVEVEDGDDEAASLAAGQMRDAAVG